jgi:Gpi18-like mannosyltransferase
MSEIKIFLPKNKLESEGSLSFPNDYEDVSIPTNYDKNVDLGNNSFKFLDEDEMPFYSSEKVNYFDDRVDRGENLNTANEHPAKIPKEPNPFLIWVDKVVNLENIIFVVIIGLAIYLRNIFVPFLSGDIASFLSPWMDYIVQHDGFFAFKEKFFDYSPAYVYILWLGTILNFDHTLWIKGISIFFDLVAASTLARIVYLKNPQLWKYAFVTTLMFPSVIFNGSMWGQCDVIYSSFVLISLLGILTKKYFRSFFFYAIAVSFKFQAVFFAPVFWFLFLFKNLKTRGLAILGGIIALVYGGSILPAYLVGRPLLDEIGKNNGLLTIYLNQGKVYGGIVMGSIPNLYQWVDNNKYEYFYPAGVVITLIVMGILSLVFVKTKISNISNENIVRISYLTSLAMPFFLPKMHERYMFLAELMCLVYVFWFPKRFWIGIITGLISYSIYIRHIIGGSVPLILQPEFNAMYILGIISFLIWEILQNLKIQTN